MQAQQQILNDFAETRVDWLEQMRERAERGEDTSNYLFWDIREHFDQEYPENTPEILEARKLVCDGELAKA